MEKARRQIRDIGEIRTKGHIRAEYKERRESLTAEEVRTGSECICRHLVSWELFWQMEHICFYYPLGKEVNLLPAAEQALSLGKNIYFPRTRGSQMNFFKVSNLDEFQEGNFHVMEPVGSFLLEQEDVLVLVPGVVFDRQKNRMGYGKGYYDRYMAEHKEAVMAGIAYECQIARWIPTESHDIPMDHMITEAGIW